MNNRVLYPGTFDPITYGHIDIIERASSLFDQVVVAVAPTVRKTPYLPLEKRLECVNRVLNSITNVKVITLEGLAVDCARQEGARVILRGLRSSSDYDYERELAHMNRQLAPDIETLFMLAKQEYDHISGTIVREIVSLNGDISSFVPSAIAEYLKTQH